MIRISYDYFYFGVHWLNQTGSDDCMIYHKTTMTTTTHKTSHHVPTVCRCVGCVGGVHPPWRFVVLCFNNVLRKHWDCVLWVVKHQISIASLPAVFTLRFLMLMSDITWAIGHGISSCGYDAGHSGCHYGATTQVACQFSTFKSLADSPTADLISISTLFIWVTTWL